MPYKRKADRNRNQRKLLRGYRKTHAQYMASLEVRVVQQDAEIALLRAIMGRQEDTGYSWEREQVQDRRILQLEADLARLEVMVDSIMHEEPYDPQQS